MNLGLSLLSTAEDTQISTYTTVLFTQALLNITKCLSLFPTVCQCVCEHNETPITPAFSLPLSCMFCSILETMAEHECVVAGDGGGHLSKRELHSQLAVQIYGLFPPGCRGSAGALGLDTLISCFVQTFNFSRQCVCVYLCACICTYQGHIMPYICLKPEKNKEPTEPG